MNDNKRVDPTVDLRRRWRPAPAAVAAAEAAITALVAELPDDYQDAIVAAIPMVQPGKSYGFWQLGQQVITVPGVIFLGLNRAGAAEIGWLPNYVRARDAACRAARDYLRALGQDGTVAWASVTADGNFAVFEDFS